MEDNTKTKVKEWKVHIMPKFQQNFYIIFGAKFIKNYFIIWKIGLLKMLSNTKAITTIHSTS